METKMLRLDANYYELYGQLGALEENLEEKACKPNVNAEADNLSRIHEGIAKMKKKVAKVDVKVSEKTSVAKLDTQPAKLVIVENPPAVKEYAKVLGAEPDDFGGPNTGGLGYTRIPPTDNFEEAVAHLGEEPTQLDGIAELLLQMGEHQRKGLEHGFKQVSKALRRQSVYVAGGSGGMDPNSSDSSSSSSDRGRGARFVGRGLSNKRDSDSEGSSNSEDSDDSRNRPDTLRGMSVLRDHRRSSSLGLNTATRGTLGRRVRRDDFDLVQPVDIKKSPTKEQLYLDAFTVSKLLALEKDVHVLSSDAGECLVPPETYDCQEASYQSVSDSELNFNDAWETESTLDDDWETIEFIPCSEDLLESSDTLTQTNLLSMSAIRMEPHNIDISVHVSSDMQRSLGACPVLARCGGGVNQNIIVMKRELHEPHRRSRERFVNSSEVQPRLIFDPGGRPYTA